MTFYQSTQQTQCSNCGSSGHTFRICVEPVSSYGVLVFRWVSRSDIWTQSSEFCKDNGSPIGLMNCVPQILMIQRKDSLGFMDIMRGKYKVNEPDYIKKQLRGMTINERQKLLEDEFESIWQDLWGSDMESSQRYKNDRLQSKQKLLELREGIELPTGERYTLADLLRQEPSLYQTPEWGFPKGRRDPYESDLTCAYRELAEETSIVEDELWKATNIAPFIEQFYGSNNIHYRHSYYLAQYVGQRTIAFNALNSEMTREIGNLQWMNLDEALVLLRPENVEKRGILVQLANLLRNFAPILRDDLNTYHLSEMDGTENKSEEQQNQYVFASRIQRNGMATTLDRSKRTFGTRQTHRRVSDIRGSNQSQNCERNQSTNATTRTRGSTVSGYRRQIISIEAPTQERVQGDETIENNQ